MTQGVKNNNHICIRIVCLLQIIFIFIFVHHKYYSLHSGPVLQFSEKLIGNRKTTVLAPKVSFFKHVLGTC